jgi:ABC-type lipoprotein release transport system permease subunit
VNSKIVKRYFEITEVPHLVLEKGEDVFINVQRHAVSYNLGILASNIKEAERRVTEMEDKGFFLTTERSTISSAKNLLIEAQNFQQRGLFDESFLTGKKGYIESKNIHQQLDEMITNSHISTFLLIGFLALMSTIFALILQNEFRMKLLLSIATFIIATLILSIVYPGFHLVQYSMLFFTAFIAITACIILTSLIPRVFKHRRITGIVPVWMIIIPIFSLAKRGILRRPIRFFLTLSSIIMLVISFVTFTSVSQGYGLLSNRLPDTVYSLKGLMIRSSGYSYESPKMLATSDLYSNWIERQKGIQLTSQKAENIPFTLPVAFLNDVPINGLIGINQKKESAIISINKTIFKGRLPNQGEIAISQNLSDKLNIDIGSYLNLHGESYLLVGILTDALLTTLREIDNSIYLPSKLVNLNPGSDIPTWLPQPCEPSEVVVMHLDDALQIPLVGVTRVAMLVEEGVELTTLAERLAIERGYWVWSINNYKVSYFRVGEYFEGRGLPLIIPWIIVVMNVVVTMLNSLYERKKDIYILSSIGVNPSQISAIFLSEAMVYGLIGGGIGYLGGLSVYKIMALMNITLNVHQKISAIWSLASISVSMSAVLIGSYVSLTQSVVITPSLKRRWNMGNEQGQLQYWDFDIPIKVKPDKLEEFMRYIASGLRKMENGAVNRVSSIREISDEKGYLSRIDFTYIASSNVDNFITKNSLLTKKNVGPDYFDVKLRTYGTRKWARTTGSMIRIIVMRWSLAS